MTTALRKTADGELYTISYNEFGYGVCSAARKEARFCRAYQVYIDQRGRPTKCSCPYCVHAKAWCKHLQMTTAFYEETQPQEAEYRMDEAIRCGVIDPMEAIQ